MNDQQTLEGYPSMQATQMLARGIDDPHAPRTGTVEVAIEEAMLAVS
jgi:hypothetical protein